MDSLKKLFRIGVGPSSSHTMAPKKAAEIFLNKNPKADHYKAILFASLAATGKGHLTDKAIEEVFFPASLEIVWREQEELSFHPNGMRFEALNKKREVIDCWEVFSIGGGALAEEGVSAESKCLYPLTSMDEILSYCHSSGINYWEYVESCEGEGIWRYLEKVWEAMQASLLRGLATEGVLPGKLSLSRKASSLYAKARMLKANIRRDGFIAAYAYAVSEENANSGTIVTAPTCGSCGIVPSVLYYLMNQEKLSLKLVIRALAVAGLIGNIVKERGSISGAEVGCQGEIGTACAMAAGAAAYLMGGSLRQIEYASEMGLEHHLGLTCDPVDGLVQIPCIERNAHAATRALSCCHFALLSDGIHKISFDDVVDVMKETGCALPSLYRETSTGGLAKIFKERECKYHFKSSKFDHRRNMIDYIIPRDPSRLEIL
jgi:L-serine dehydratase